jgi:chromate reductase, NAD(P)H dehydrogenase (quinone)
MNVLGICGSLRKASFNRALLHAAVSVAPAGMNVDIFDRVRELPLYNADVEQLGDPEPVVALKQAVRRADAVLIATPEYNYSVPGVLKNAIDWASRPPSTGVLRGKPIAIFGASPGNGGTIRAQYHIRQTFVFTQSYVMVAPEIFVPRAHDKFQDGVLTDEPTREHLRKFMTALADWTRKISGAPA